ncbi:MAG: tetratricopeptide repeat protein [Candidatus Poribacteria bacterium]
MKKSSSDGTAKKKLEPIEEPKEDATQKEVQNQVQETTELAISETHLSIADSFFYDKHDYEKAIAEYSLAINEEKDENLKLKANYMMAECYVKLGKYKEAKAIFEKMATDFGKHFLGASAKRRLAHLSDYLVIDEEGE